ncbi:MAG: type II toxin-antitoxin system VapC family toxin [Candidatus Poribacteria bacterium]
MSSLFLDTSAVVKRYIDEPGSDEVRRLVRPQTSNHVYIAHITIVEGVAAIARRARAGDVTAEHALSAYDGLQRDADSLYSVIPVGAVVSERAVTLARANGLRGYDAVQLAAALLLADALRAEPVTLVSADRRMWEVARHEGMNVIDPTAP